MNIATMEDVNYLAKQSTGHINMILSGMTALMNDTESKVTTMESQGWFKRMIKTVTGKNKLTQVEIQQNHDKLNVYMSEAMAELYNRNCIDHEVMMSLGTQINELYADHLQLKNILGMFVSKLNEKIDSVDNFHMLKTEIEQGVYSDYAPIIGIAKVISQFDNRLLEDSRKLDIIHRSLVSNEIINDEEVLLTDYLMSIMEVPTDKIGQIYLELGTIRENFMASIMLTMMEKYHFLPDMERKIKNKKMLINDVFSQEGLDDSISLSIKEIYDDFVNSKKETKNGLTLITDVQVDLELEDAEKLYLECRFDEAYEIFKNLAEKGNGRAMYFMGEYYVHPYGHVERDIEEGKKWRQRGSDLRDILSALNVAYSLPKDSDERSNIFNIMFEPTLRLAESGDVFAQSELADLYIGGLGTAKDVNEGLKWRKKSADAGFWHSKNELGRLYYNGKEVKVDKEEAFKWFMKAAEQGYMKAQYNVGICYHNGEGVKVDDEKAKEWLRKAAEQGHDVAKEYLKEWYSEKQGCESIKAKNSSSTITKETLETIKNLCNEFKTNHDKLNFDISKFPSSSKPWLIKALNIQNCEEIYLAHDDTLLKFGDNGFAITNDGIYCREFFSSKTKYIPFNKLCNVTNIYWKISIVYADNYLLAYYSYSKAVLDDLVNLFKQIKMVVDKDLASTN